MNIPRGDLYSESDGSLEEFADILNCREDRKCLFCFGTNTHMGFVVCERCNEAVLKNRFEPAISCWEFAVKEAKRISPDCRLYYSRFMVAGDLFLEVLESGE